MNKQELAAMVAEILSGMEHEPPVKGGDYRPTAPQPEKAPTPYRDGDFVPDVTALDLRKLYLVEHAENEEKFRKMKEKTPARLGSGRAGARYKTLTMLRFRADHAAAQDAVFSQVSEDFAAKNGMVEVRTKCRDKDEYLTRPDLGRCFDEENQQMVPAKQIRADALYQETLRNVPGLVSRDLDGDGTVEIPTQPDEAGLLNMSQSRRMDFIVWMDYTSPEPKKSFGLMDEEINCYIELPAEWEGNLMLTDSTEEENAVELRTVDDNQLMLTIRLVNSSESAAGWTRLGVAASRQLQARFGPDVTISDQSYRLSRSLYRLN